VTADIHPLKTDFLDPTGPNQTKPLTKLQRCAHRFSLGVYFDRDRFLRFPFAATGTTFRAGPGLFEHRLPSGVFRLTGEGRR
jgi:hypothetical protein